MFFNKKNKEVPEQNEKIVQNIEALERTLERLESKHSIIMAENEALSKKIWELNESIGEVRKESEHYKALVERAYKKEKPKAFIDRNGFYLYIDGKEKYFPYKLSISAEIVGNEKIDADKNGNVFIDVLIPETTKIKFLLNIKRGTCVIFESEDIRSEERKEKDRKIAMECRRAMEYRRIMECREQGNAESLL